MINLILAQKFLSMPVMLDIMNININKTIKIEASLLVGLTTKLAKNGLVTDSNKTAPLFLRSLEPVTTNGISIA